MYSAFRIVIAILAAGLLFSSAIGQSPRGERYAFLVAVRKYPPTELRDLKYSEPDILELRKVLLAGGYRKENVVLLTQTTGAEEPRFAPELVKIRRELKLLLQDKTEADSVVVAFAGHGVQFKGMPEHYFCASDVKLANKQTLLPLSEVYDELEKCGAGMKVMFVDACRNDPLSSLARSGGNVEIESVTKPQKRQPAGGIAAFFSCSEGEQAFEHPELGHGVFFNFVIDGLRGGAAQQPGQPVTLPELEYFVKKRVSDYVRANLDGARQMPEMHGKVRGLQPLLASASSASSSVTRRDVPPTRPPSASQPSLAGFESLFNGRTLEGWEVISGSREAWKVDKEEIVVTGDAKSPGWLMTTNEYTDFVLRLEYQVSQGANSGVTFRALGDDAKVPEIQILDDAFYPKNGPVHSTGSLWSFALDQQAQTRPAGMWNLMEIEVVGTNLRITVNGMNTVQTTLKKFASASDAIPGFRRHLGRIGLQNWAGGTTRFRNVRIKTLACEGMRELFNGKDMNGWRDLDNPMASRWAIKEGCLTCDGPSSYLYSDTAFGNFYARCEVRIDATGNSGFFVRAQPDGAHPKGYEVQISYSDKAVKTGGLYLTFGGNRIVPPREVVGRPNEWITMDIVCDGNRLVSAVNGKHVVDWTDPQGTFSSGRIALQHHNPNTRVQFRRIEVKELP